MGWWAGIQQQAWPPLVKETVKKRPKNGEKTAKRLAKNG